VTHRTTVDTLQDAEAEAFSTTNRVPRSRFLQGAGLGALGAVIGLEAAPTIAEAKARSVQKGHSAEGAWHATVHVDGSPIPFDTLYSFVPGGVFGRVDGRNNAPSYGEWQAVGKNAIVFAFLVFSFSPTGQRNGTITALSRATVQNGTMTGPFTATGVDMTGSPLVGFPKTGTFEAERLIALGP
jgi:hypothetical protein